LSEELVKKITPIALRTEELMENKEELIDILNANNEKARKVAE